MLENGKRKNSSWQLPFDVLPPFFEERRDVGFAPRQFYLFFNVYIVFLYFACLQECSERENGDNEANSFHIIDAFDVPRFTYSLERKKFLSDGDMGREDPVVYSGKLSFCINIREDDYCAVLRRNRWRIHEINVRVWCVVRLLSFCPIWQSTDLLLWFDTSRQERRLS